MISSAKKNAKFLVQKLIEGEIIPRIMTGMEVIRFINDSDMYDVDFEIYECGTEFGKIEHLTYVGWQPNCYIQLVNDKGETVLDGYGEDH